jgi:type IV secretory pathway component VirB8
VKLIKIVIAMVVPFDLYVDHVLSVKQEAGGVKVVVWRQAKAPR